MITTRRTFEFNASHAHAHNGNGGRPHLHAYTVTVEARVPIGGDGECLAEAWESIRQLVEDADLDAELVAPRHVPASTVEHVADFLLREFEGEVGDGSVIVQAVTVADSPSTSATATR